MSSAISIERKREAAGVRAPAAPAREEPDSGFRVWHFFVLLSLLAATVAVVMMRQGRPEVLILVSVTIGAIGGAAIGFYRMLAPLAATDAELASEPLSTRLRADLDREKALTLRSIKELEFDRAMGKVSAQDFEDMAGRLRARAIGIMKQLDTDRSPYRAVIEKELASRLSTSVPPVPSASANAAAERASIAGCACGTVNDPDARFCKTCGKKLATEYTEHAE